MTEIESLRQQLDYIKEVDFPRKVEAVSNGWRTRLDAERIVAKERFEKLLSWVDDYCEVDDKDFVEIEPVVNAVLGEAIETNPLSDLRQQLASCQAALADTEALEIGTGERLAKVEQQLANSQEECNALRRIHAENIAIFDYKLAQAIAACKLKDEALKRWKFDSLNMPLSEFEVIKKALAIQPDDSALRAWIGEPVAWLHEKRPEADVVTDAVKNVWNGVVVGKDSAYSIPLYSPKGLK